MAAELKHQLSADDSCKTAASGCTALPGLTVTAIWAASSLQGGAAALAQRLPATLKELRNRLKDSLACDKVAFLERTAEDAAMSYTSSPASAWRNIKILAAWGGRKWGAGHQPVRRDQHGVLACSPEAIANIELDHFARIEEAEQLTVQQLCSRHQSYAEQQAPHGGMMDEIMTRPELTASFHAARCKRQKKPGPDQISDGVLSVAPRAAARHAHPLLTKWAMLNVQPLGLKGSTAAALYNRKGGTRHHGFLPIRPDGKLRGQASLRLHEVAHQRRHCIYAPTVSVQHACS